MSYTLKILVMKVSLIFPSRATPACWALVLGTSLVSMPALASERHGSPAAKGARSEVWREAPWRNPEPNEEGRKERGKAAAKDRAAEARNRHLKPAADQGGNERQRLSPEARRELRQQIHEVGKELYQR